MGGGLGQLVDRDEGNFGALHIVLNGQRTNRVNGRLNSSSQPQTEQTAKQPHMLGGALLPGYDSQGEKQAEKQARAFHAQQQQHASPMSGVVCDSCTTHGTGATTGLGDGGGWGMVWYGVVQSNVLGPGRTGGGTILRTLGGGVEGSWERKTGMLRTPATRIEWVEEVLHIHTRVAPLAGLFLLSVEKAHPSSPPRR